MLPGFRFLFAAIMLSLSLLVFGLGAAALLRAAHESFASNPSWRAAPEVTFAQRTEPTPPVLATLRVDTPVTEKAPEQAPLAASSADPAPAMPAPATMSAPAISEQVAALKPIDAAPSEAKTSETKTSETATSEGTPPAMLPAENLSPAATPAVTEATATGDQATIAANTTPAAPASEPPAAQPEPTKPEPTNASQEKPAADQAGSAPTTIATLGGPPVDIIEGKPSAKDKTAKPDQAKTDPDTMRRVQAKRALHRRRLAARARLAAQQQFQAGPFGQQPFTPATSGPRP